MLKYSNNHHEKPIPVEIVIQELPSSVANFRRGNDFWWRSDCCH